MIKLIDKLIEMCRIAGIIDQNRDSEQLRVQVQAMCDSMKHGGPDGEGFYTNEENGLAFGHRRLALIDLSPTGSQPMTFADNLNITFNGEIYNFNELKFQLIASGYQFNTKSDTEVILASYAAYGTAAFNLLNGMFAFALHDKIKEVTYLVRDRTGIKPLYYSHQENNLIFASETRAFLNTDYHFSENPDWKIYLLAFGHLPEPYSTINEIEMLPKGCFLKWSHQSNTAEIQSYITDTVESKVFDAHLAQQEIEKTLKEAVKRHLIADAPIGLFLSGGIDSSILCLLAHECLQDKKDNAQLNSLSINFDESKFSEKPYQDLITSKLGGKHQEFKITELIFNTHFAQAIQSMDQPSTDGLNSWFINYFARENGLKAVISGIGADELFGGYPSFKRMGLVRLLAKLPRFILRKGIRFKINSFKRTYYLSYQNTIGKYLFLRGIYSPNEIASLLKISIKQVDEVLLSMKATTIPDHLSKEEEASWLEYNLYMQNQLLKDTDNMSMQHGVEVRVPFLDSDFVRLVKSIKPAVKFNKSLPKSLLIKAFSKILPQAIWNRKKMGFTFPFGSWLMKNDTFIKGLNQTENKEIQKLKNQFLAGDLHWSKAISLYHLLNYTPIFKQLPEAVSS